VNSKPRLAPRWAALLEQALVSGANFAVFIVFARQLAPAAWGAFGFAYALVLFVQGFQRAFVTIPMVAFAAAPSAWAEQRARWARANATLALAGTLALALGAALAWRWAPGWWATSAALAAAMFAALLLHEFARRAAVQDRRFDRLALMGAAYAAVLLTVALGPALVAACLSADPPASAARASPASTLALAASAPPSWWPAVAMTAAAAAAALVYRLSPSGLALARPALGAPPPGWLVYSPYAGWSAGSHLAYSGYNFAVQAVLAALAGPAAVGAFHACRTLVQPLATLASAMDSVDRPRAAAALATAGPAAMRRVLLRSLAITATLGLPYLALVAWGAPTWLALAYGERYPQEALVVSMWCLVALCSIVCQPVESGLYVAHRTRRMFGARVVAAAVALALAWPLVARFGAAGALGAMAAGYLVAALAGTLGLRAVGREPV
jgi:O-antigen/teichoic acid export membrane protein